MNLDPKIFKAYDIRGVYPDQLDEEGVQKIAESVAQLLNIKKAVIGHDARISADTLFPAVIQGLINQGVEVIDIGLSSTPMYYFAINHFGADGGLMLTASHNPAQYNGFKLCGPEAKPFTVYKKTTDIYNLIKSNSIKESVKKGQVVKKDVLNNYINKICEGINLDPDIIGSITVDAGNGMAGLVMPKLLKKLKIKYHPLFFELDGNYPNHEPNPLKQETLKDLQSNITTNGSSLGVSIDGDGDRIGFVDEKGKIINADLITVLIAKEMARKNPDLKVMYDLRSSWVVKEELESIGIEPKMCVVGHGLIKPIMRENSIDFTGELSAHYYFKDLFYTDNADRALVFLLQLLSEKKEKISVLIASLKRYSATGEINFKVSNPNTKIDEIEKYFTDGKKFFLDGLSVEFKDWWFNLRPSNTEPLLRLNLEAKTRKLMEEKKKLLFELIGSQPEH